MFKTTLTSQFRLGLVSVLSLYSTTFTQAQNSLPFTEDFNNGIPNTWTQWSGDGLSWNITTNAGPDGSDAALGYDLGSGAGSTWLQTPYLDLSGANQTTISFDAAMANTNFMAPDLSLWYDIGNGWVLIDDWGLNANNLFPGITDQTFDHLNWRPDTSYWTTITEDLSAFDGVGNIRFSFGFEGVNGGAILVDNVSITSDATFGLEPVAEPHNVTLYPMPNSGTFTITTGDLQAQSMVTVLDLTGKRLHSQSVLGQAELSLSLAPGLYFVEVLLGNDKVTRPVVIR